MTSFVPPTEQSLPVTERTNALTKSLDVSSSIGMIRQLRQCDAQVFTGYEDFPSLTDDVIKDKILASIACIENVLSANQNKNNTNSSSGGGGGGGGGGRVILSGSGTSGRLGMLISRDLNRVVRSIMGPNYPAPFRYTVSGNDAAILLSDELPEDDPVTAVSDMQREASNSNKVCLIGITCGLSAPYVAGQVDYILDCNENQDTIQKEAKSGKNSPSMKTTEWSTIMMGFNPAHLSRDRPIEIWRNRKNNANKKFSLSVRDVVMRLHSKENASSNSNPSFILLNPIVGPEPICASSRMKGGTCTKILLDVVLGIATARVYGTPFHSSKGLLKNVPDAVNCTLESFDASRRITYETKNVIQQLASLIDKVGHSFKTKNGHLYYLGASTGGILGIIDASEMPDTYGAPFEQTRSFLYGGWNEMNNIQGDLSHNGLLYRIDIIAHFIQDIMPTLTKNDTIIVIEDSSVDTDVKATILNICIECVEKYNVSIGRIGFDDETSTSSTTTSNESNESKQSKANASIIKFRQLCETRYVSYPPPMHSLIPGYYIGYDTLTIKLALNIITTCGQIHAGMVYENHMINTGPTNAKIYDRCIRLIARFSKCSYPNEAHIALLRSIWGVDNVTKELLNMAQVSPSLRFS
jgi:N-acetylmuramic acid 6-phosphate (MurNAc-6-P) etherase